MESEILVPLLTTSAIIPVINYLVEAIKPFIKDNRFLPLIAVAIGLIVSIAIGQAVGADNYDIISVIVGLVGGGLSINNYDSMKKNIVEKINSSKIPDYDGPRI